MGNTARITTLGFNTIWLEIVMTINLETAVITTPVGLSVYLIKNISAPFRVELSHIRRGILPFLGCQIASFVIAIAFPELTMFPTK